jgi:hypothetical protein
MDVTVCDYTGNQESKFHLVSFSWLPFCMTRYYNVCYVYATVHNPERKFCIHRSQLWKFASTLTTVYMQIVHLDKTYLLLSKTFKYVHYITHLSIPISKICIQVEFAYVVHKKQSGT